MKKIILTLSFCGLLIAGYSSASVIPSPSFISDGPTCVESGNCSVYLEGRFVRFSNYNNYPVTVSYKIYGTNSQGKTVQVGGGTQYVKAKEENGAGGTAAQNYNPGECTGCWVEAHVQKCN